jgi:hypothetical protein
MISIAAAFIPSLPRFIPIEERSVRSEERLVRSTAGFVRSTAGVVRSTAGVVHSTAGVVHSTAGVVRSTAGFISSMAGLVRSTAEFIRSTAGFVLSMELLAAAQAGMGRGRAKSECGRVRLCRTHIRAERGEGSEPLSPIANSPVKLTALAPTALAVKVRQSLTLPAWAETQAVGQASGGGWFF